MAHLLMDRPSEESGDPAAALFFTAQMLSVAIFVGYALSSDLMPLLGRTEAKMALTAVDFRLRGSRLDHFAFFRFFDACVRAFSRERAESFQLFFKIFPPAHGGLPEKFVALEMDVLTPMSGATLGINKR